MKKSSASEKKQEGCKNMKTNLCSINKVQNIARQHALSVRWASSSYFHHAETSL
jgi:hypothetical protein